MPAFAQIPAFMLLVQAANPTYGRFSPLVRSSLAPLIAVLNNVNGTAAQVVAEIALLRGQADVMHVNKAVKYKEALHFLQRQYPIPQAQWEVLGANLARAVRYTQTAMPPIFNPYGPNMYNPHFTDRVTPVCAAVATPSQSVEDFIYTSAAPVGVVMIHLSAYQNGMYHMVDGKRVVDHMNSVLRAARHNHGSACALVINAPGVCADLATEFNAFGNQLLVNETGHYHLGSVHAAFRTFITTYPTIVVMGFDASVCVRANLFGSPEYPHGAVVNDNALDPITTMANVVTSRALMVTQGPIIGAEYGLLTGT